MNTFGERLHYAMARRVMSQSELADRIGLTQGAIGHMLGRSEPSKYVVQLAQALAVRPEWLALDEGEMDVDDRLAEYVLVPRYDAEASAGPGTLSDDDLIVDHMAFRREWVTNTLNVEPRHLALLTAAGDSMEPTIRAGDLLLIDTGVNLVIDDSIYVLVKEGWLVVKRLQRFFGGVVVIKSDNPQYVEETVGPGELEQLHVAGRVRWIGRLL